MTMHIAQVTFLVRDYDEAIQWFKSALGFELKQDAALGPEKRWVIMGPMADASGNLLLAKTSTPEQAAHIGKAAGGRVAFFLHVADFSSQYERMQKEGVRFLENPRLEAYGTVAVFEDLYGNRWDLIQAKA